MTSSPFLDFFRRGEVPRDIRLLAARGAVAPRAYEQIALLALLTSDADPEIRSTAETTLASIPESSLATFLGKSDVGEDLRAFFRARGIEPDLAAAAQGDDPLIQTEDAVPVADASANAASAAGAEGDRTGTAERLSAMNVSERMKVAMRGTREERAILVRDPNKLVSVAVLSSPKLTDAEVESFAKMGSVSEEVLRIIGMNRNWTKSYGIISALVRNPKTPLGLSLKFVQRLNDKDLKLIALDRNLQEPLKLAVRKRLVIK